MLISIDAIIYKVQINVNPCTFLLPIVGLSSLTFSNFSSASLIDGNSTKMNLQHKIMFKCLP
jgi:hypothetical protein